MSDTTTPGAYWAKADGGYGRPAKMLRNAANREVAILVTLPKAYAADYNGLRYMVTDRRLVSCEDRLPTREFVSRRDAVAYAEATYL